MKKILVSLVFILCLSLVTAQSSIRAVDVEPEPNPTAIAAFPVDPDPEPPKVEPKPVPGALPELPPYCPDDMYLCNNNDCVEERCECDDSCEHERCPDGLLLCDSGRCVKSVGDCVDECKHHDSTGRCVEDPEECKHHDDTGRCVERPEKCEEYDATGTCVRPEECRIKCQDGRCVDNLRECEEHQCEDGLTECMDGVCRLDKECPVKPICECPRGYEMCDSGYCVRNLDQCKELRMNKADLIERIAKPPMPPPSEAKKPKEIVVVGSKVKEGDPDRPVITGAEEEEADKNHKGEIDIESWSATDEPPSIGKRISGFFRNLFS